MGVEQNLVHTINKALLYFFYESTPGKQTYKVDLMSATLIGLL